MRDDGDNIRLLQDRIDADWRSSLQSKKDGDPLGNLRNTIVALESAPELRGILGLNSFDYRIWQVAPAPWDGASFKARPWTDASDSELQNWLQENGIQVLSGETVHRAVNTVAARHEFHPVRDYLDGLQWDGTERLGHWLSDYLGVLHRDYSASIGRKFLIGAVARIYAPGCKMDNMLVLEGPQGIKKSLAVRTLAEPWVSESLPDVHSKDAMQQIAGAWIVEVSELSAIRGKAVESVKGFLSRQVDRYRPPYQRRASDFPRQSVFIGTTNEDRYLEDKTGNRRFWPVCCTEIDIDALAAARDQLMAEAVHRYRSGEPWHFTTDDEVRAAAAEQDLRRIPDPWEGTVRRILDNNSGRPVTVVKLLEALGVDEDKRHQGHSRRVGDIARAYGWVSKEAGHDKELTFFQPKLRGNAGIENDT